MSTSAGRLAAKLLRSVISISLLIAMCSLARGQDDSPTSVLTDDQWDEVDESVERALDWLASQQNRDGSFPTLPTGQPGVTSLCVLAFLAHGHVPGSEPYGSTIERALEYILSC